MATNHWGNTNTNTKLSFKNIILSQKKKKCISPSWGKVCITSKSVTSIKDILIEGKKEEGKKKLELRKRRLEERKRCLEESVIRNNHLNTESLNKETYSLGKKKHENKEKSEYNKTVDFFICDVRYSFGDPNEYFKFYMELLNMLTFKFTDTFPVKYCKGIDMVFFKVLWNWLNADHHVKITDYELKSLDKSVVAYAKVAMDISTRNTMLYMFMVHMGSYVDKKRISTLLLSSGYQLKICPLIRLKAYNRIISSFKFNFNINYIRDITTQVLLRKVYNIIK
jgi:hypothetical protein